MNHHIEIKGARVNNLKNIHLSIPRDKLIVVTGVSGSGKSSLAFDTLYAEGQRRYVESLSSYARQFLGRMSKPDCDLIKGLPPAIAIEQKTIARNPRSTVGTTTEIYEYLRLLFARIGRTYSPVSGSEVKKHSTDDILACIHQFGEGTRFLILAPLRVPEGRTLQRQLEMEIQQGYVRLWYKNDFVRIEDFIEGPLADLPSDGRGGGRSTDGSAELWLLIDRLSVDRSKEAVSRVTDSVETAMFEGDGTCRLVFLPSNISYDFSNRFEADGMRFEEPSDNLFSFNSPLGACPTCEGFGRVMGIDEKLVIPNSSLSVYDGCVQCWHGEKMGMWKTEFCRRAARDNFPIFKPYNELSTTEKDMLWHGLPSEKSLADGDKVCLDSFFQMLTENQYKIQYRVMLSRYRGKTVCPDCRGTRLKKEATWVKIGGMSICDLVEMPIVNLKRWFDTLQLTESEQAIGQRLLVEINNRLQFLLDVGLGYLTLNRPSNTLSGGESQRVNLSTSLGSPLVGSLYILDEPSIGLHSRDTQHLIRVLRRLQSLGNTVLVVEHDEEIMRAADYIIHIGPQAGRLGGEVMFEGDIAQYLSSPYGPEAYMKDKAQEPFSPRPWNLSIGLRGCRMNNLKGIDVTFPLNVLTVVTGVSGSGKSSLVKGILYPALKRHLNEVADLPGDYSALEGDWQLIQHVEMVDQNPIGKSTRSNPATYVKAYDSIRQLFAEQPLSKQMGFSAQYFSFNADGGRCEECKGAGVINVEMQFMADLVLTCDSCHGRRFKSDILEVNYRGRNIDDILNMTISEAIDFFSEDDSALTRQIVSRLQPLQDVGLGYIKMGQNSSTLSGGENQRVKLAYYVGQERQEPTLFIFDEPTTGLHYEDIQRLLSVFDALIERGHSILVIEHNLHVIRHADYVIDLGPDGGDRGGFLVACGTPADIARCSQSATGEAMKR
ncbi:MAG: excinuclease ABC subunit UvrA [Prevotella sp.]|nr:excinuclease ABC subunit UvrA [Prevotella sp.]